MHHLKLLHFQVVNGSSLINFPCPRNLPWFKDFLKFLTCYIPDFMA